MGIGSTSIMQPWEFAGKNMRVARVAWVVNNYPRIAEALKDITTQDINAFVDSNAPSDTIRISTASRDAQLEAEQRMYDSAMCNAASRRSQYELQAEAWGLDVSATMRDIANAVSRLVEMYAAHAERMQEKMDTAQAEIDARLAERVRKANGLSGDVDELRAQVDELRALLAAE